MIKKYGAKRQRERRKGGKEEGGGRGRKGEKKHSSRQKNYLITPRPGIEPGSSA